MIVKGTFEDAEKAAKVHGIELLPVYWKLDGDVTTFTKSDLTKVVAWYSEPGEAPYPPGTLLFYVQP